MKVVLRHAKNFAVSTFACAGIDRVAVSLHSRDALVLVYHGIVSKKKGEPFRYHHTADEFEAHLDWLGAHCAPVGLADFMRWRRGDWQPTKPPVLITFDDGYRNNATLAAPLMLRKGFPAVFFLATGYIGGGRVLWPDEVFARVLAWTGASLDDPAGETRTVPERPAAREALGFAMVEACKNCSDTRRREFLTYLASETPHCDPLRDPDVQEFMSWNEVRGLAAAGFDLGSHTVSHPILSNVSPEPLRAELRESRAAIEAQTGRQCTALAYPNGRARDVTDAVLMAAADAGYDLAVTVSNRWSGRTTDALQVDRISTPGHSNRATFALHASGSRRWLPRLR
jgi:peptidoglycan/xylan/chitin deacetylase (PgdA/CDA1 family)